MELARQYNPAAISLDIFLPDMMGWTILSYLKQNPETRHVPILIVTLDEERLHGLARGAFAYLNKSASSERIGEARRHMDEAAAVVGLPQPVGVRAFLFAQQQADVVRQDVLFAGLDGESCDCLKRRRATAPQWWTPMCLRPGCWFSCWRRSARC